MIAVLEGYVGYFLTSEREEHMPVRGTIGEFVRYEVGPALSIINNYKLSYDCFNLIKTDVILIP